MSEPTDPPAEAGADPLVVERRASRRWQVGLRTLVLMMAMFAVWMTVIVNRRQSTKLENRIRAMQPLAHELKIDDLDRIAVVKLDELWMDDNRWDLYLPAGEYRVCVASREIGRQGLTPARKSAPIKAGKHRLALEFQRKDDLWPIRITSDGTELFAFEETKEWGASGSSTGAGDFGLSTERPADQPLVLYRRRYHSPSASKGMTTEPPGPVDGLLMWIEPVNKTKLKP